MSHLLDSNPGLSLIVEWIPFCMETAGQDPRALPPFLEGRGFSMVALDELSGEARDVDEILCLLESGTTKATSHWYLICERVDGSATGGANKPLPPRTR